MLFRVIRKSVLPFFVFIFSYGQRSKCADLLNSNKRRTILNCRINAALILWIQFKFQNCVY